MDGFGSLFILLILIISVLGQQDSCRSCLLSPSKGWCETKLNNGFCLVGNDIGPLSPQSCNGSWFFNVCPPVKYINATIWPLQNTTETPYLCNSHFCTIPYNAFSISGSIGKPLSFTIMISPGHVIYSMQFLIQAVYCNVNGNNSIDLSYSIDQHIPPVPQQHTIDFVAVDDCQVSAPKIQTDILPFVDLPLGFWWYNFNYSLPMHSFSFSSSGHNSITVINMIATFGVLNVDPQITSYSRLLFVYCDDCNQVITIGGHNFMKLDYQCLFESDKQKNITIPTRVDIMRYNCPIPFNSLPIPPSFDSPTVVDFSIRYGVLESEKNFITNPHQLTIIKPPFIKELVPPTGVLAGNEIITVVGSGFIDTKMSLLMYGIDIPVTYINSTSIEFLTPSGNSSELSLCLQISFEDLNYRSQCINFTYIKPPAVPSWLKDYWYYVLILTGVVSLVIIALVVICKIKRKKKNSYMRVSNQDLQYLESNEISPDEIERHEIIGVGSFATVYRGTYNGEEVAVKAIRYRESNNLKEKLLEEAGIMHELKHPNIVQYLGACFGEDLFIITEYVNRGSLYNILHDENIIIETEHIRKFALDTCKGMEYLHKCSIIHRDLKTHNLLVDNNWNVKVSDFGLARSLNDAQNTQTLTSCGTPSWAAPEVLKEQKYSLKADVYSFSICLWELVTRQKPYTDMTSPQVIIAVAVKKKRLPIPKETPKEFKEIITDCWQADSKSRPTFSSLCKILINLNLPQPKYIEPYFKSLMEENV